jgi:lipoprotein-releasing system permease protein
VDGVTGVAPFVYGKGMVSGGGRTDGIIIKGVDLGQERSVTTVAEHIEPSIATLDAAPGDPPSVVMGRDLAERLHATVGDEVTLGSPFGSAGPLGFYPRLRRFRVVGIFTSGLFEYDSSLCFISRQEAQRFFQMGESVTGVELRLAEPLAAQEAKTEVLRVLGGYPYRINTWIDLNRNLFLYMKIEKFVLGLILLLIVLVAAFNIVGALVMVVMEKKRDIGILKSMGSTDGEILRLFMTAGGEIGLLGIVTGAVLGCLASVGLGNYRISIPNDVYFLDTVPIRLKALDVAVVMVVVFVICWLATLYPAWKAARLSPVDAIRES